MDASPLRTTRLFRGIAPDALPALLDELSPRSRSYTKGDIVLHRGSCVRELGLVLSGSVCIENTDIWGTTSLLGRIQPGGVFAETYAALGDEPMLVDVVALEDTQVLFLDMRAILAGGADAASPRAVLQRNAIEVFARKNLNLSRRIFNSSSKTIRGRVLSYLSDQARAHGSSEFTIPLNRQQLADYLSVDRSALSNELSKMVRDGLIETRRSHFVLHADIESFI